MTTVEASFLVQNFDAAELYQYEQESALSVVLLKEWLAKYKFKNWKKTEKRGLPVTRAMRVQRAQEIAQQLNNTEDWHSHSRGIPMAVLRRKLNLVIDDFAKDPRFDPLHDYYRLLQDYELLREHEFLALHRNGRYVGV